MSCSAELSMKVFFYNLRARKSKLCTYFRSQDFVYSFRNIFPAKYVYDVYCCNFYYFFQPQSDEIDKELIEFRFLLIEACSNITDTQLKVLQSFFYLTEQNSQRPTPGN